MKSPFGKKARPTEPKNVEEAPENPGDREMVGRERPPEPPAS